jgi:hypothetical protein
MNMNICSNEKHNENILNYKLRHQKNEINISMMI